MVASWSATRNLAFGLKLATMLQGKRPHRPFASALLRCAKSCLKPRESMHAKKLKIIFVNSISLGYLLILLAQLIWQAWEVPPCWAAIMAWATCWLLSKTKTRSIIKWIYITLCSPYRANRAPWDNKILMLTWAPRGWWQLPFWVAIWIDSIPTGHKKGNGPLFPKGGVNLSCWVLNGKNVTEQRYWN